MKTFQDDAGRTWALTINVTAAMQVKGRLGLNLYTLVDDGFKGLAELFADPLRLYDVIYVLCKDEADKLGISYEDFGRGFRADAILVAGRAFHDEFADFFHQPVVRAGLKKMAEARALLEKKQLEVGTARLEAIDLDDLVTRSLASSTNAPASSGSTPDPSPSES